MVEEKIDYKKAVDMAKAIEQINQREGDRPSREVYAVKAREQRRSKTRKERRRKEYSSERSSEDDDQQQGTSSKRQCKSCGGTHQTGEQCFATDLKCHKCGRKGHLRRVCPKRGQTNVVASDDAECHRWEDEDDVVFASLGKQPGTKGADRGFFVDAELNGYSTRLLVDTGASRSLLSVASWHKMGRPRTTPAAERLVTLTGERISLLGKVELQVRLQNSATRREMLVCRGSKHDLIGRDWIAEAVPGIRELFKQLGDATATATADME
ncbi:MAG: hypothetical protein GY737_15185 [Desulfobacteraceae bacterium]|nr:hypothetical protein [Desulfobacteraceae bacterium]